MLVVDIYENSIKTVYRTTFFSKTALFVILVTCLTVAFPFIFAYRSRGFWLKHDTFFEQPDVRYRGEFLLVGITSNRSNLIVCNNFNRLEQFEPFDTCSRIKAREIDHNYDNRMDEFDFQMNVDLPIGERLQHFALILAFDYKLHTTCPLSMRSAVIVQEDFARDYEAYDLKAHLKLHQSSPLKCINKRRDVTYNGNIFRADHSYESYNVGSIIKQYLERNVSTHLQEIYASRKLGSKRDFALSLNIQIPEHIVAYKASFWQVLKFAWIQYLAIYVVFACLTNRIVRYVFENNLLLYYKACPLKKRD